MRAFKGFLQEIFCFRQAVGTYSEHDRGLRNIYSRLDEYGQDYIEELIPHEYVQGKNHGVPDKEGFVWGYKPDAGGFEPQLKELEYRFWDYLKNAWERLEKDFWMLNILILW